MRFVVKRLLVAALLVLAILPSAQAANRFWNPYSVTNAISGTGGVCRLTISPAITGSGLLAGTSVITTSIAGATGCNVTATISTVVDSTHIELTGTTFGGAYTSGGCVAGGIWTATNTSNWASSSTATCGSGGQTVPGSADTITLDANSLGGTIIPNTTITAQSITCGAFTGTLDFSVNNNNVTLSVTSNSFNGSGSGTRTINLGNGTWTLSGTGAGLTPWMLATTTNLTFNANSSTIDFTGVLSAGLGQLFNGGGLAYNIVKISGARFTSGLGIANSGGTIATLNVAAAASVFPTNAQTITTLTQGAQLTLAVPNNLTLTFTNAPTLVGTASAPLAIINSGLNYNSTTATLSTAGAMTGTWISLEGVTFAGGGSYNFTNCSDLGKNVSYTTCTAPSSGGGGRIIGGWLLKRDLHPANDNSPAFLENVA